LLHEVGSSNPILAKSNDKTIFHPYFTAKDAFIFTAVLVIFFVIVSYYPNILGHSDNSIPANPLVTPTHIVPEWYFTPFYAILRSCPNKIGGVIGMLAAILILFLLPYIGAGYKNAIPGPLSPIYNIFFFLFVANFLALMYLGGQPAEAPYVLCSKFFTLVYFSYLLGNMPLISCMEKAYINKRNREEKERERWREKMKNKEPDTSFILIDSPKDGADPFTFLWWLIKEVAKETKEKFSKKK